MGNSTPRIDDYQLSIVIIVLWNTSTHLQPCPALIISSLLTYAQLRQTYLNYYLHSHKFLTLLAHSFRRILMSLTERQKKHLRGLAHPLHPVVMVGGKSETPEKLQAICKELDNALQAHELVKVSVRVGDREARDQLFAELVKGTSSEFVQRIGNMGVLYRARKDKPKIILPDA